MPTSFFLTISKMIVFTFLFVISDLLELQQPDYSFFNLTLLCFYLSSIPFFEAKISFAKVYAKLFAKIVRITP